MRGSYPKDILTVQEDAFEDHSHDINDPGHSHSDTGHTHPYVDETSLSSIQDDNHIYQDWGYWHGLLHKTTDKGYAQITTDKSRIEINSAKNGRSGTETRPKNMAVQWIIRIF